MKEFLRDLTLEQCYELVVEAYSNTGGLEMGRAVLSITNNSDPPQNADNRWCICDKCRDMGNPVENKCCRKRICITTTEIFRTIVLDTSVLSVAIVSRGDDLVERVRFAPANYRKAAYRQFIMWEHGYLGRGVRRVIPSCVVWAVRDKFPAPDGNYLGFKEY